MQLPENETQSKRAHKELKQKSSIYRLLDKRMDPTHVNFNPFKPFFQNFWNFSLQNKLKVGLSV